MCRALGISEKIHKETSLLKRTIISVYVKAKEKILNKIYKSMVYIPGFSERYADSKCYEELSYSKFQKTSNILQKIYKPQIKY